MSATIPSIPAFAAWVDSIFAKRIADLQALKAKAEAAIPGSGAYFDQAIAEVQQARAAVNVQAAAQLFVTEIQGWLAGTAPIVHKGSDLAR